MGQRLATGLAHLDADAFFASVEQAADARLRGRPIAVGGGARGVIASASYEARARGVRTAMPTMRARQLCPELVMLPGNYPLYEQFSAELFALCRDWTPAVEQRSVDEGYVDCRLWGCGLAGAVDRLQSMARTIRGELKIGVSFGLAANRMVAQIASKWHKPHGFAVVPSGSERCFMAPLPVGVLPGVGPKTLPRLEVAGLLTVGDLLCADRPLLAVIFGNNREAMLRAAAGVGDDSPVEPESDDQPLSLGEQQTFDTDLGSFAQAEALVKDMLDRQLVRLRGRRLLARSLGITVRYTDFAEASASRSLAEPSDLEADFYPLVTGLLRRAWSRRVNLRLIRVQLSRFYPPLIPLDLFGGARERLRTLASVSDQLNARFGTGTLRRLR
jgi:DNA polymerase IV